VTKEDTGPVKRLLTHPGETLLHDFMKPLGITQNQLGRLARHIGTTPQFWLNLQTHYDLDLAEDDLGGRLEKEVKVQEGAA
jgi:plasmid maintenance system antidote protein VapI